MGSSAWTRPFQKESQADRSKCFLKVASSLAIPEKALFWNTPGKPAKDVKCGFQKGFEAFRRLLGVLGGS